MSSSPVNNCDDDVCWYRRLPSHPRPMFETAARAVRDVVAQDLKLREPYPNIIWYEPVDHVEASRVWNAACQEHPDAGWRIDDNPFTTPVDIFRFLKVEKEPEIYGGYTHKDGPRLIGILAAQPAARVFESIAHECVHVSQDERKGPGWRMDNISEAEEEASAYESQARSRFAQQFKNLLRAPPCSAPSSRTPGSTRSGSSQECLH